MNTPWWEIGGIRHFNVSNKTNSHLNWILESELTTSNKKIIRLNITEYWEVNVVNTDVNSTESDVYLDIQMQF